MSKIKFLQAIFYFLSLLGVISWLILYQWYSLTEHLYPFFGLNKIPGHFQSPIIQQTTAIFVLLTSIYFLNFLIIKRVFTRGMKITFVFSSLIILITNIFIYPVTAADFFNYLLYFKTAFYYLQNPYLANFLPSSEDQLIPYAFQAGIPLFYGPVWLLINQLPAFIVNFSDLLNTIVIYKSFSAVLTVVTAILIACSRDSKHNQWAATYLFLANPLVIFESVTNAHNDIVMAFLLVMAVILLRKKSVMAFPVLFMAILTKFFVLVMAPVFLLVMIKEKIAAAKIITSILLTMLVIILSVLPFWKDGQMIGNILHGMEASQSMNVSSVFSLTREYLQLRDLSSIFGFSPRQLNGLIFAMMGLLVFITYLKRRRRVETVLIEIYLLFSLFVSLLCPWYLVVVAALTAMAMTKAEMIFLFGFTLTGFLYYSSSEWAWYNSGLSVWQIHLVGALFLTVPIIGYFMAKLRLMLIDLHSPFR